MPIKMDGHCDICGEPFSTVDELREHKKTIHQEKTERRKLDDHRTEATRPSTK